MKYFKLITSTIIAIVILVSVPLAVYARIWVPTLPENNYTSHIVLVDNKEGVSVEEAVVPGIIGASGTAENLEVYFSDTIQSPMAYTALAVQLEKATPDTVITIHLIGFGGNADTVLYLENLISRSKATVIMDVDGSVYSAHAMIAMLGKQINIGKYGHFMFHYPAAMNYKREYVDPATICPLLTGVDRGIPNSVNCANEMKFSAKEFEDIFQAKIAPYLTAEEIKRYHQGYQVHVSGPEMARRLEAGHA